MSSSPLFLQTDLRWWDWAVSFVLAVCCHAAAFCVGGAVFVKPPEHGIEPGGGGIEVNLVAALPQAAVGVDSVDGQTETPPTRDINETVLTQPTRIIVSRVVEWPTNPAPPQQTTSSPLTGDGSSPAPGKDATTLYRPGGAWTNAKPSQFRNPAPWYPELARQRGQQGLVVLMVRVDTTGHPTSVAVKQSSGFPLLDEAATTAVSHWRFAPARAGGLPIESTVEIPIRFRLEDE